MIPKIPRRAAALLSGALALALGGAALPAAAAGQPSSDAGRLRMAYRYECLNAQSLGKIKQLLPVGPGDLHPCAADSARLYAARCVFTAPGGGTYQEHIDLARDCQDPAFAFKNGQRYDGPVTQLQCDYLHALPDVNGKPNAFLGSFNSAAYSPAAQRAVLVKSYCYAVMQDGVRRLALSGLSQGAEANAAFEYFTWQARRPQSYLVRSPRGLLPKGYPLSWYPYVRSILAENRQDRARAAAEVRAFAAQEKRLKASGLAQKPGGSTFAALNALFDRAAPAPAKAAPPFAPADPFARVSDALFSRRAPVPDLMPSLSPDTAGLRPTVAALFSPPPPPLGDAAAVKEENFGARGLAAAAQRLEDDYKIAYWHYFDLSRTVGRPAAALPYALLQKSGSCGVASQYEALRARGIEVDVAALAKEAYRNGWYGENDPGTGVRSAQTGTSLADSNKLLSAHGLPSLIIYRATVKDLEDSIVHGGGAIVSVSAERLWNGTPGLPDDHSLYVSGAEVAGDGRVLGYYVNDTGTGEGMRFVSAALFDQAWEDKTGHGFLVSLDANAHPPQVELAPAPGLSGRSGRT